MRSLAEIVKANREAEQLGVKSAVQNPVGTKKPATLSPERMQKLGLDKY